jgi:hypothetical protein
VLPSGNSICVIPVPSSERGNEMLDCTFLDSQLRLERATVWCLGGLLEAFLLSLPSLTRVGPTGVAIRCMQGGKTHLRAYCHLYLLRLRPQEQVRD